MMRLRYLDLAKGFGILLVVLGHATFVNERILTWVFSFHMPLFFIISGMLITHSQTASQPMHTVLKKRLKSILIPYLVFSICYTLLDIAGVYFKQISLSDLKINLVCTCSFAGSGPLWFLTTLFFSEIIFIFLIQRLGDKKAILISLLLTASGFCIWHLFKPVYLSGCDDLNTFFFLCFPFEIIRCMICLGFLSFPYAIYKSLMGDALFFKRPLSSLRIIELLNQKKPILFMIGLVFITISFIFSGFNSNIDIHNLDYGNVFLFMLNAYTGSAGLILICKSLPEIKIFAPVLFWGKNSLTIMATHLNFYILYLGGVFAYAVNPYITRAKEYIFLFNILLITMIVETVLILLLNRFLPWAVGKNR